jgi:hypothetical protein
VVVQSSYIPWKGYFDLIGMADELVLYDEVQYTKNDWRNRNRIKTVNGLQWLTIPVAHSGRFGQRVNQAIAADSRWREKHWRTLAQGYASSEFFHAYRDVFEQLYLGSSESRLSKINRTFIETICALLGIRTRITWSTEHTGGAGRVQRLVSLCRAVRGTIYLSGPSARSYLDESLFSAAGIKVEYMQYEAYPVYFQFGDSFEHEVSVLDLLFHVGPDAPRFMKFPECARLRLG